MEGLAQYFPVSQEYSQSGPRTHEPDSLGIPPNLQGQDDGEFQVVEQVAFEAGLQMGHPPARLRGPLGSAFGCPLSPYLPLFSMDDASLMELGSCSLTQCAVPHWTPDVAAPTPPPGFIQSEAKPCCNLRGGGDNGKEQGKRGFV